MEGPVRDETLFQVLRELRRKLQEIQRLIDLLEEGAQAAIQTQPKKARPKKTLRKRRDRKPDA